MTLHVSEKDLDPVQKIQKLETLLAGLQLATSGALRDLEEVKAVVLAEQEEKRPRHLWAVPGVMALAAWHAARKYPVGAAAGTLAAGSIAAAVFLALPPSADPPGHRPEGTRPPIAEPMPPVPLPVESGEKRGRESRSSGDEDQGHTLPVAERPVEDPETGQPPGEDPEPPTEPEVPKDPPTIEPVERRCAVALDLNLVAARVTVSVCSSAPGPDSD